VAQYWGSKSTPSSSVQVSPTSRPENACATPKAHYAPIVASAAGTGP
jgi:hypothetical protein